MSEIKTLMQRIEQLEIRAAYQGETIEDLNKTITAQWTEIDRLKRQIEALTDRVRTAEANAPRAPEPPPPHY